MSTIQTKCDRYATELEPHTYCPWCGYRSDEHVGSQTNMFPEADEWANDCNPRISKRWHMTKPDGSIAIVYGEQMDVLRRAIDAGYTNVTPSGYWTSDGNKIVDPQDGEFVFTDMRPSGRLYSQ